MKKLSLRLLCLALCLAALASLVPGVSAEGETDGTVGALIQPTEDMGDALVCIVGEPQWNPLLGGAPEESDGEENRTLYAAPDKGYIFYDNTPFENVLAYMRDQMKARKTTFAVTYQTGQDYDYNAMAQALFEFTLMHTGVGNEGDYLRWIWRKWGCSLYGYPGQYITYTFNLTYLTTAAQESQMDTEVTKLLNKLNLKGCTNYQKVCKIYDWICNNVTYDHTGLQQGIENSPLSWTAYKALTQGTSVCQGYASLFYRLALESGVDARVVSGIGNGGAHGWNIVKLGGYYYNLDATWDSEYAKVNRPYEFFLRCTKNFKDHVRDDEFDSTDFHHYYPMSPKDYTPGAAIAGDMNGDEILSTDDAVYLLLHVMFGSKDYPITAVKDMNGDGKVNTDDAVYLLLHVMFGAKDYPLAA